MLVLLIAITCMAATGLCPEADLVLNEPGALKEWNMPDTRFVNIALAVAGVVVDLRYASKNNFTGHVVYDFDKCLLLHEAAERLREVQEELETMGLGLKVWDGYRPIAAQWKFWELVPDPRYVGDPRKGGRHTRGTAVDLTLVTSEGEELAMPSEFDEFSERAHRDYTGASSEETRNRQLLFDVMHRHGFSGVSTEWWHFDLVGWEAYPPVDIDPAHY